MSFAKQLIALRAMSENRAEVVHVRRNDLRELLRHFDRLDTEARAAIPPEPVAVPDGWKLVRTELTDEQIDAACMALAGSIGGYEAGQVYKCWDTLLSTAPQPEPVAVPDGWRDFLSEIEWQNNRFADLCPVCGEHQKDGHADGCRLAVMLATAPQPKPQQPVQALTDDQIWHEWVVACDTVGGSVAIAFARAIEARLK